jgi:hypothetical protein
MGLRFLAAAILLCFVIQADAGHKRSYAAKQDFRSSHPCPATGRTNGPCPGYVIDHVIPLKRGGPDTAINMQWQTKDEAKKKARWE